MTKPGVRHAGSESAIAINSWDTYSTWKRQRLQARRKKSTQLRYMIPSMSSSE
jgi:hypothetical protein